MFFFFVLMLLTIDTLFVTSTSTSSSSFSPSFYSCLNDDDDDGNADVFTSRKKRHNKLCRNKNNVDCFAFILLKNHMNNGRRLEEEEEVDGLLLQRRRNHGRRMTKTTTTTTTTAVTTTTTRRTTTTAMVDIATNSLRMRGTKMSSMNMMMMSSSCLSSSSFSSSSLTFGGTFLSCRRRRCRDDSFDYAAAGICSATTRGRSITTPATLLSSYDVARTAAAAAAAVGDDTTTTTDENKMMVFPTIESFNNELKRITAIPSSNCSSLVYVEHALMAEELLDWMLSCDDDNDNDDDKNDFSLVVNPNTASYNIVLKSWSRAVYKLVHDVEQQQHSFIISHRTTGGNKISATDGVLHAERLLKRMEDDEDEEEEEVAQGKEGKTAKPNIESYNIVLDCILQSYKRSGGAAERIEELIKRMKNHNVIPNAKSYEYIIDGWIDSKFRHSAQRAERALKALENVSIERSNKEDVTMKPTLSMYKGVLKGWSRHEDLLEAAERSEALLKHMHELYDSKTIDFTPDTPCYTAAIDAWRRTSSIREQHIANNNVKDDNDDDHHNNNVNNNPAINAAIHAECLLNDMMDKYNLLPFVNTYTSVIQTLMKCSRYDDDAPLRAEELLERMEHLFMENNNNNNKQQKRNHNNHNSNVVVDDDDSHHSEIRENNDKNAFRRPNVITYTTAINAWGRSRRDNIKAQRALGLLKRMTDRAKQQQQHRKKNEGKTTTGGGGGGGSAGDDDDVKLNVNVNVNDPCEPPLPNVYTYNGVINACATTNNNNANNSDEQNKALKIAFAVFKALRQNPNTNPNHVTYGTLLKATHNLLPMGSKERNDVTKAVFEKAIMDGQVDIGVFKQFKLSADKDLFYDIMKDEKYYDNISHIKKGDDVRKDDDVPMEWKRNVSK